MLCISLGELIDFDIKGTPNEIIVFDGINGGKTTLKSKEKIDKFVHKNWYREVVDFHIDLCDNSLRIHIANSVYDDSARYVANRWNSVMRKETK